MTFVLDTSVAIPMRDGDAGVLAKVQVLGGPFAISIITRVELEGGVYANAADAHARRVRLDTLLASIPALAFGDDAASAYGRILAASGYSRRKVIDRMIAAQALVLQATLVTLNPADFADVPGLRLHALA